MIELIRRFRGAAIALAVLALSAGVVFAGGSLPSAADFGLQTATEASGQGVLPARPQADRTDAEPSPASEETGSEPTADADADVTSGNHGGLVSEAARMEVPVAFEDDRGAFVSCVARMNHGHEDGTEPVDGAEPAEPLDLNALTPDDCEKPGKPESVGADPEAKAAAKAAKAAAKAERAAGRFGG